MELKCEDAQAAYIAIEVKLRKTTTGLVQQKVSFSSRIIVEMNITYSALNSSCFS